MAAEEGAQVSTGAVGLGYVFIICCVLSVAILLLSFFRIKHLDLSSESLLAGDGELKEAGELPRTNRAVTAYLTTDGRQISYRSTERVC
jgi:hypothetical protein